MKCPKCHKEQVDSVECMYCGVVIEKYRQRHQDKESGPPPEPGSFQKQRRDGFKTLRTNLPNIEPRHGLHLSTFLWPPVAARYRFYTVIARMVRSGVSLEEAMTLASETGRGRLQRMASHCLELLGQGHSMEEAMRAASWAFPPMHISVIASAENTGHMAEAFEQLATQEQHALEMTRKFASYMAYPFIVLILSCFLLPIPSLVFSGGAGYAGQVVDRLLLVIFWTTLAWPTLRLLQYGLRRLLTMAPGSLELRLLPGRSATFFEVLGNAIRSGLPITDGLDLARHIWTSAHNRHRLDQAIADLNAGATLSSVLSPFVAGSDRMILEAGERSGTLEETFKELKDNYRQRSNSRRKVGFILAAVFVALAMLGYVAMQSGTALESAIMPSSEEIEMLNRELKGTGLQLF